jgi:DNA-binding NarL/FixJ family response regulator
VLSPEERARLIAEWHRDIATTREIRSRLDHLTRSEASVLGELMAGLQVSDISRDRFVSESTVRTQVKSILAKLQVGSQLAAVGLAHRAGWRPPTGEHAVERPGTHV